MSDKDPFGGLGSSVEDPFDGIGEEVSPDTQKSDVDVSLMSAVTPRIPVLSDLADAGGSALMAATGEVGELFGIGDPKTFMERYEANQKEAAEFEKARKEQYPVVSGISDFAGAATLPGASTAQAGWVGAETLASGGDLADAATQAGITKVLGKGAEVAGPAVIQGMQKLGSKFSKKPQEMAKNLLPQTKKEGIASFGKTDLDEQAKILAESGLLDKVRSKEELAAGMQDIQKGLGEKISDIASTESVTRPKLEVYEELLKRKAGETPETASRLEAAALKEFTDPVTAKYAKEIDSAKVKLEMARDAGDQEAIDRLTKQISDMEEAFGSRMEGDVSLSELWDIRKKYDKAVPSESAESYVPKKETASAFRDLEDELAAQSTDAYKAAKTEFSQNVPVAEKLTEEAVKSNMKNKWQPSLVDSIVGGPAGFMVAGPAGAVAGPAAVARARNLWKDYGNQLKAVGYKKTGKLLSNPKYARMIQAWANKGPAVMQSSHYLMMNRDPEYRKAYREDKESGVDDEQ